MRSGRLRPEHAAGLLLLLLLGLTAAPGASAATEIVINIPAFTLYVYEDGVPVRTFPIGVGQVVKPSQLGTTEIINVVHYPKYYPTDWYARGLEPIPPGPENPVGTRWLGLGFRGYGIHGTNDPGSIGKAASAGCIRMHNRDVELLAEMVGVGTPVTFLYETVEVWRDPLTLAPYVRVYDDVYRQGTNTLDRLIEKLSQIGADAGADRNFLEALLAEASGTPHPVPVSVPLDLDGERVDGAAAAYGGRLWVSLDRLAARLGDRVTPDSVSAAGQAAVGGRTVPGSILLAGRAYAPIERAAEAFGLLVEAASAAGIRLRQVALAGGEGERLPWRVYVAGDRLLVPVTEMAEHFGLAIGWDPALQAVVADGRPVFGAVWIGEKAYLSHDRAAQLLGVEISWTRDQPVASLVATNRPRSSSTAST